MLALELAVLDVLCEWEVDAVCLLQSLQEGSNRLVKDRTLDKDSDIPFGRISRPKQLGSAEPVR